ncbi:hypothetical protein B7463_g3981, partial [Scytalidium lignicola]
MVSEKTKKRIAYWAQKLECPVDDDANYENTYWCNRDLIPIPEDRRTWTWQGFAGYWIITGANNSAWTAGSTLLALGLSVGQSMGVIVGGSLIISMIAVVAGWMGSHDHLGFTVMSRASWGMIGGFWPVLNRIVTACIWMGVQTYWGGQAVKIILGAVIGPKYAFMTNTLPLSANVDTCSLVSFFIFLAVFCPMLWIPPENLQLPLKIAFAMIVCNIFGMLIWSVRTAHGAGALINSPATKSDWTRYAKTPNASLFGQGVTCPLTIIITALCGLIITSASATIYGEYFWNPFLLLLHIQSVSMTPAARAAGFVRRVQGVSDGNGWDHVCDLSYFFGFFVSGILHWALHIAFPTPKQTGASPFEMELHRTRFARLDGITQDGYVDSTISCEPEAVRIGQEKEAGV